MSGVRIFCNSVIPVDSWDHDFVVVPSRLVSDIPLPTLVSFDLFNPLDNSGNGNTVTKAGGIIKPLGGLGFTRAGKGSTTDFIANTDAISVLCAVKPESVGEFSTFLDCRNLTPGEGSGFAVDFSSTESVIRLQVIYPSGNSVAYPFPTFVAGEWNVLCITLSAAAMRGENQHGEIIANDFTGAINLTRWTQSLLLGQGVSGGTCDGSVGFVAVYDGILTPTQRKEAIQTGLAVITSRI
ncbi:hypothetical protein [Klebsiella quasipneumoniae]|uniref:hypothetical protein n=1 Tax=Klebsiella quasipneumoniae TaxID=1463165 RepID=UPI001C27845E|nr:hypothetical protein [Klebsiella quasipneumoniae]MBU8939695.1 hypothetical protein [Klebsiella quasipneumoniae]